MADCLKKSDSHRKRGGGLVRGQLMLLKELIKAGEGKFGYPADFLRTSFAEH